VLAFHHPYTTEGDPNSNVIIGDSYIMVSDATATPGVARDLIMPATVSSGLCFKKME